MKKVIVVGAGIAGLTAAYELKKRGIEVLVLEAEPKVGGRTKSIEWQDMWIDLGAQFFNSIDADLAGMVSDLGLDHRRKILPAGLSFKILRDKNWHDISLSKPGSVFSSGLLSMSAKIRMLRVVAQVVRAKFRIGKESQDSYEICRIAEFDDESVEDWLSRANPEYLEYILAPAWELFFSYRPKDISKATILYAANKPQKSVMNSFDEGVGLVTRTIAGRLNLKTDARVTKVTAGTTTVEVEWEESGQSYRDVADGVVVAVRGDIVNSIVQGLEKEHVKFFEGVRYLPADMNYFTLKNKLEGYEKYRLFPRREEPSIKGIYYGPCKATQEKEYLIVCMKTEFQNRTRHMADSDVLEMVEQEAARYIPQAVSDITNRFIVRWPSGIPAFYPGYIRSLKQFRRLPPIPNVAFAGDYLNFPTTGGAYRSGRNAADYIAPSHKNN